MAVNPKFKKIAIRAAKEAGEMLKKHFRKSVKISFKKDLSLLTDFDLKSEKIIIRIIKNNFSPHQIISEESGGVLGKDFTWVIDPLDGTTNYTLGFPFFSVSIALLRKKKPILGVVYNPIVEELYFAEEKKGAFLNQKKIRVNKAKTLPKSLIVFNKGSDFLGGLKVFLKIASRIRTFRSWGSSNLEICQVAAGKMDGYLSIRPAYHDAIAGAFIAKEAGAKVTDFKEKQYSMNSNNLIVANKSIHKQLLKIINK